MINWEVVIEWGDFWKNFLIGPSPYPLPENFFSLAEETLLMGHIKKGSGFDDCFFLFIFDMLIKQKEK